MFDDGAEDNPRLVRCCRYGMILVLILHYLVVGLYLWGHAPSAVQHVSNFA